MVPSTKVSTTTRLNAIQPFPENPTGIYGDIAPTGFFDPAGLSKGKDAAELKQWREAEIKHGRVCMLATAGILTQEIYQFLPFNIQGAGIHHFDLVDAKVLKWPYFPLRIWY